MTALHKELLADPTLTDYDDRAAQPAVSAHIDARVRDFGQSEDLSGYALHSRGNVLVGRYCALARGATMVSTNHRTDMPNQQVFLQTRMQFASNATSAGPICVGHNVWFGANVTVLSGVSVGHGAVAAAGAAITSDASPFASSAASPRACCATASAKPWRKGCSGSPSGTGTRPASAATAASSSPSSRRMPTSDWTNSSSNDPACMKSGRVRQKAGTSVWPPHALPYD